MKFVLVREMRCGLHARPSRQASAFERFARRWCEVTEAPLVRDDEAMLSRFVVLALALSCVRERRGVGKEGKKDVRGLRRKEAELGDRMDGAECECEWEETDGEAGAGGAGGRVEGRFKGRRCRLLGTGGSRDDGAGLGEGRRSRERRREGVVGEGIGEASVSANSLHGRQQDIRGDGGEYAQRSRQHVCDVWGWRPREVSVKRTALASFRRHETETYSTSGKVTVRKDLPCVVEGFRCRLELDSARSR
ncbi:hypothetical protein OE88DRAFT_1509131 [Heliocybe sulcata]|uniref:Uncharacterized protein n=1 Tax=Heliocybe sulcata TaxID=5364 RepID=A0A5C3MIE0_9AGAM|nr:hypothetical protein OE88DRAFT_1509131 [Heliocybe sulcata]